MFAVNKMRKSAATSAYLSNYYKFSLVTFLSTLFQFHFVTRDCNSIDLYLLHFFARCVCKKVRYCFHLLIIYANSLDPDQDRQDVGPILDPKVFDRLGRMPC